MKKFFLYALAALVAPLAITAQTTEQATPAPQVTVLEYSKVTPVTDAVLNQTPNKQTKADPKMLASAKATGMLNKVEMRRTETGVVNFKVKEGQKLNVAEKLALKKANKQIAKIEKNEKASGKAFKDWDKYLRYGIFLLAGAFVLSIVAGLVLYSGALWALVSIVWLAGVVLFWYGLGRQLEWW